MVAADHTGVTPVTYIAAWTATVQTAAYVKSLEAANVSVLDPPYVYVIREAHGPGGVTVIMYMIVQAVTPEHKLVVALNVCVWAAPVTSVKLFPLKLLMSMLWIEADEQVD